MSNKKQPAENFRPVTKQNDRNKSVGVAARWETHAAAAAADADDKEFHEELKSGSKCHSGYCMT